MIWELWDRVTGRCLGEFDSRADAEAHIPAEYKADFVVIEVEDDEAEDA